MLLLEEFINAISRYDLDYIERAVEKWSIDGIDINTNRYPVIRLRTYIVDYYNRKRLIEVSFDDFEKKVVEDDEYYHSSFRRLDMDEKCVLFKFLEAREQGLVDMSGMQNFHTSGLLRNYMTSDVIQSHNVSQDIAQLYLKAIILETNDIRRGLHVEFKIAKEGGKSYVVKSVQSLLTSLKDEDPIDYGKELKNVRSIKQFNQASQKLIQFLIRINDRLDQYQETYEEYYSGIGRYISLKGVYLDEFMEFFGEIPMYLNGESKINELTLVDEPIRLRAYVKQLQNDYEFSMENIEVVEGNQYVYEIDHMNTVIRRAEKNTEFLDMLNLADEIDGNRQYLSRNDLKQFSGNLYPVLKKYADVEIQGFDPIDYMPEIPNFELYLDYPQDDFVTCSIHSVYKENKYNVLKGYSEGQQDRNVDAEKQVDDQVSAWFNSFNPTTHELVCADDDEKLYNLLTEGIPYFQTFADVFVSDRLKKLNTERMPRVSIGISVDHDLLQLQFIENKKTMDELAEILSKYEPKKRFYKLRNGSIMKVDEENVTTIANMMSDLQLDVKDVQSGEVEVPKYRAMYLDRLASEVLDVDRDRQFKKLIQEVHDIEDAEYAIPESLDQILRDYQKAGYRWLRALQANGFGGLLADEMGLGKSIQVIALLQSIPNRGRCLIVCPASLVYNWRNEFKKFGPDMDVVMLAGNAKERQDAIEASSEHSILITSYDSLRRDIELYEELKFDVEVIDEAQYIKNATTLSAGAVKEIQASFRIALTGTPIENRISELWSIFDYLMPGFLYTYPKFKRVFETPIVKDRQEDVMERLRKMVSPFILRRRKKDVLKDLPEKLEEVIYAPLEGEQKDLYEARVERLKKVLEKQSQKEFNENKLIVLSEITKLRQTCCAPSLLYDGYQGNSGKEDICIDLILRAIDEGHKILLFSQFKSMLQILTKKMDDLNIHYHLLTGDTSKQKRAEMVDAFQKDDIPVFCISLKAGGTGLNLTAADIVIHYDPWWNTAVENQATDRAHRIGQDKIVSVYRLIMQDTIEERIIELQQSKSELGEEILSGEGISNTILTKDQLMEIL